MLILKRAFLSTIFVFLFFLTTFLLGGCKGEEEKTEQEPIKEAKLVKTRTLKDSKSIKQKIVYPAIISSKNEIEVIAKVSGNLTNIFFEVGTPVKKGQILAKIDNTPSALEVGDSGFKDLQVLQAEKGIKQAELAYNLAKNNYEQAKKSYKRKEITKSQLKTSKIQKEIAEVQHENAKKGLEELVDAHKIYASESGIITQKFISQGDAVAPGQKIAVINDLNNIILGFYVDELELPLIKKGEPAYITTNQGNRYFGIIQNISPIADSFTKRFLIEVVLNDTENSPVNLGSVANIELEITRKTEALNSYLVPISALTVGQKESYLFIMQNNTAHKQKIDIKSIVGDNAEIEINLPEDTIIILEGNKLLKEGDSLKTS